MSNDVIYELPLNERIRTFLRLEHLFDKAEHYLAQTSEWSSRVAIDSLLDILTITSRTDLKTELNKEIDRHSKSLKIIAQNPDIDEEILAESLAQLQNCSQKICTVTGKIGSGLIQTDLLKTISQRVAIPGGTCDFDVPSYHQWLNQPSHQRLQDLEHWASEFAPFKQAIKLLLQFIRLSANAGPQVAVEGFYQQALPQGQAFQLIRVFVDSDNACFAEISGGRHRFSIRFMAPQQTERPVQTDKNISFRLALCSL